MEKNRLIKQTFNTRLVLGIKKIVVLLWAYWWLSIFVTVTLVATLVVVINRDVGHKSSEDFAESITEPTPFPTLDPDQVPTSLGIVLIGHGGAGHQGGMLADVIQVLWLDFDKSQVALISIPRDLWIPTSNGGYKINAGLAQGGGLEGGMANMKQVASSVTGLPVNYAVTVDFVGFKRLIGEVLKGIEVNVSETLEDPWYPITGEELNPCGHSPEEIAQLTAQYSGFELEKQFACRYEHLLFKPGINQMQGGDALAYVRSRHGSGAGDFSRSRRQHEVLVALRDKMISLNALDDLPEMFETISYTIHTDVDLKLLNGLLPTLKLLSQLQPQTIILSTENVLASGTGSNGAYLLQPKNRAGFAPIHQFIQSQLSTP